MKFKTFYTEIISVKYVNKYIFSLKQCKSGHLIREDCIFFFHMFIFSALPANKYIVPLKLKFLNLKNE